MTNEPPLHRHGYLYRSWTDMIRRCHDRRHWHFDLYGERGIEVCAEWRASFEDFARHIGPRPTAAHSVDRIDNDRGYEPGNVRWATREEQMNNTRACRRVTYAGRTMTISQWARELGMSKQVLHARLTYKGMSTEEAFTTPYRRHIRTDLGLRYSIAIPNPITK